MATTETPGATDDKVSPLSIKMDELIDEMGKTGRFQILVFILLCFNYCPLVFNHVIMAFFGARITHTCHAVGNISVYIHNSTNKTVIGQESGQCDTKLFLDDGVNLTFSCKPGQWTYDTDGRETTIGTEWDLVCDDDSLRSLATTVYFCGVMLGGLLFGYLSDRFGRRPIMLVTLYAPVVIGLGIHFVPSYTWFVCLRFVEGIFLQGLQISTYVLVAEMFVPAYRPLAGAILECFWGASVIAIAAIAYLVRDWRYIQLAISIPSGLALFYICVMPESLRWMIMRGRLADAEKCVSRVTTFNRKDFPKESWASVRSLAEVKGASSKQQYTFLDLLKTPQMRKRSILLFYIWFAVAVGYYGLTFKITSLAGNKYLNFFIGGCVEMLAYIIGIYVMVKIKRRVAVISFALLAAVTCIIAGALPSGETDSGVDLTLVSTGFAIVGRFAVGGLFSLIFLYTSEVYPTVIRNIGMGTCAFWTRVGGVIAPQINRLGEQTSEAAPIIVFGVMTVIVAVATFFLPETHKKKIPNTIQEVEGSDEITSSSVIEETQM
ncbi:solute carrier family 22 member 6-A-like [Haliotis rufescens]|uniref:solute carrier family 22 member 6-A-like n=1 Tax=Haliotis rufescens TaxID=6454 RepID=UPI00201EA2FC|nr:solute carrier family 22 member 6-A-like [Haliotis rufescens]